MSSQQVVVMAVPVKPAGTTLAQWLRLLIGMNVCMLLYLLLTTEISGYTVAYVIWGIWLPCFGSISLSAGEFKSLSYFGMTQCYLSVLVFCCALSVVSFYNTFNAMCDDCAYEFYKGIDMCFVDSMNVTLTATLEQCMSMPEPDVFYSLSGIVGLMAIVGMCAAYEVRTMLEQLKTKVVVVPNYVEV